MKKGRNVNFLFVCENDAGMNNFAVVPRVADALAELTWREKRRLRSLRSFSSKKKKKSIRNGIVQMGRRCASWRMASTFTNTSLLFTHGLSALYLPRLYVDGITMQTANQALWDGWGCLGKEKQNKYRKAGKAQNLNK